MNGYQINAAAYKKYLSEHPEEPEEVRQDMQRKQKALETMAESDKPLIYEYFNTSAFNDIAKGYFLKALNNIGADRDTRRAAMNEISLLFDEMGAEQAESYYMEN